MVPVLLTEGDLGVQGYNTIYFTDRFLMTLYLTTIKLLIVRLNIARLQGWGHCAFIGFLYDTHTKLSKHLLFISVICMLSEKLRPLLSIIESSKIVIRQIRMRGCFKKVFLNRD